MRMQSQLQRAHLQRQSTKIQRLEASQRTRQTLELCKIEPEHEMQLSRRSPQRRRRRPVTEARQLAVPYVEHGRDRGSDKTQSEVQSEIYFTLLKWQSMAILLFMCWGANHLFRLAHVEVTWN